MHVFETLQEPRLRIRNAAGAIRIETADTAETTVELDALRDDDATREAIERATIEQSGSEVTVEVGTGGKGFGVGPAWISFGRTPQVGIRIRCPEGAELECFTASADVLAIGRLGDAEIKTASGDVSVEAVARLRVQSASGDVRATAVGVEARLQTVSGDVTLGTVGGPVTAKLVSGDFALEDGQSDVEAKTVSGDQRVDAIRQGSIKLHSVSGDVRLGVRPGTRLRIDATSTSGEIRSEFDVKDGPSGEPSGAEASLQIKTVSGDIGIVRAAEVVELGTA